VAKAVGGVLYMGIAARFQHRYYQVTTPNSARAGSWPVSSSSKSVKSPSRGGSGTGPASAWRTYPASW
jgi:hypothetical protein